MTWGLNPHRPANAHREQGEKWSRRNAGSIQKGKKAVEDAKSEKENENQ